MVDPVLKRRLEMTGWSTVLLGFVCVLLAALQAVTPILLARLEAKLDDAGDPMLPFRESWSSGAASGAWVNGIFGVALIVIGIAVSRRARWAHGALTVACWASIAILAVLAKPTLAPFFAVAGAEAAGTGSGMVIAGLVLVVAQVAAVLWFLRFWRKPEVRGAFR